MRHLDPVIDELVPICRGDRPAEAFHFDPDTLSGAVRFDVPHLVRWLGFPAEVLPFDHVFIHAHLDVPAKVEFSEVRDGSVSIYVYLNAELYRAPSAVYAGLAHELAHLFLVLTGRQTLQGRRTSEDPDDPEEVRTEVAAVALGFGKLMLAGVADYAERDPAARLGYLSLAEFEYVYDRVNQLAGVPRDHAAAR